MFTRQRITRFYHASVDHPGSRRIRAHTVVGGLCLVGVLTATLAIPNGTAEAATTKRKRVKVTVTSGAPRPVSTLPPPTTLVALPEPTFLSIGADARETTLRLGVVDAALSAIVEITSVGFERINKRFVGAPGQAEFRIAFVPNPDTQYTVRVAWSRSDGSVGPTARTVIAPKNPQPVNRQAPPVAGPGWTSLLTQEQRVTRRNPCVPWKIVYDRRNQPLAFEALAAKAIAEIRTATGAPIIDGGVVTTTDPDPNTIMVSWDMSATATLGLARQRFVADADGVYWRTTGLITMAGRRRGITPDRWYAVLLHELGHIFGLDHSHAPESLMYSPVESGANWPYTASVYTDGDRAGLFAQNGKSSGGCTSLLVDPFGAEPVRSAQPSPATTVPTVASVSVPAAVTSTTSVPVPAPAAVTTTTLPAPARAFG